MAENKFHHPFEPYEIQNEFMSALYQCIDESKIGIFESPTGRQHSRLDADGPLAKGKSLSLICGSLTWLREHKRKEFEAQISNIKIDDDEPEWIRKHAVQQKREAALRKRQELEKKLAKIRAREQKLRVKYENGEPQTKRRRLDTAAQEDRLDDEQFALADYESDDEPVNNAKLAIDENTGLTADTLALMSKLGYGDFTKNGEDDSEPMDETKVFFCSRTHSQLSQFSRELQRVKMPPPLPPLDGSVLRNGLAEDFKHLTLGSRKNLCINPKVSRLGNATAINERCLELQQTSTSDSKCPFVPTKETESVVNDFRDHALAKIRDIEDLGKLGKELGICPYYASRPAIKPSEIVTLPYPLLLQKTSREVLGLSLKDHVVIIDEAHNLIDTITGIHSTTVSLSQLERSRAQVMVYLSKYRNKLKGKNRVYVAQVVRLIDSLISALKTASSASAQKETSIQMGDMMAGKGVDQINLYKLNHYLLESKLARKVDGYITHEAEMDKGKSRQNGSQQANHEIATAPALMHVQNFLLTLTNPSTEGQFFYAQEDGDVWLKYLLLDPTHHFQEVVAEARSVILAGGTMAPMSDFTDYLFSYLPVDRIMTLSCGHVIPPANLLAIPVVRSHSNQTFDFTFEKRNLESVITDLGLTIHQLVQHVPDGVVIFFPSYAYLDKCLSVWQKPLSQTQHYSTLSPSSKSIYTAIQSIKPIFTESRSPSSASHPPSTSTPTSIEALLTAYTTAIQHPPTPHHGALLLAVTSGRLSEGINFSDALGRCVLIIGLPFANPSSASLAAKLAYIASRAASHHAATHPASSAKDSREAGEKAKREYYENSCMRAVNQSIGRAIRHKGDYAAILMLDRRFGTERIGGKLPGWIKGSLKGGMGVREAIKGLDGFFEGKRREREGM